MNILVEQNNSQNLCILGLKPLKKYFIIKYKNVIILYKIVADFLIKTRRLDIIIICVLLLFCLYGNQKTTSHQGAYKTQALSKFG